MRVLAAAGQSSVRLAVDAPVEPMLAKLADELPVGAYLYEPKWDGFRAIVFPQPGRGVSAKPRFAAARSLFSGAPRRAATNCVVDGEIVIRGRRADSTSMRCSSGCIRAASRVEKLAKETPSSFDRFRPARGWEDAIS